jgi:hypothetical protein
MAITGVTWEATIMIRKSGNQERVRVQATRQFDAKTLIQMLYKDATIIAGPVRIDLMRAVYGLSAAAGPSRHPTEFVKRRSRRRLRIAADPFEVVCDLAQFRSVRPRILGGRCLGQSGVMFPQSSHHGSRC